MGNAGVGRRSASKPWASLLPQPRENPKLPSLLHPASVQEARGGDGGLLRGPTFLLWVEVASEHASTFWKAVSVLGGGGGE